MSENTNTERRGGEDPAALWDRRYSQAPQPGAPEPALVLADNAHLLPARGRALDLACGLGNNALFLAARGLETHAWDISPVAIGRLREAAAARGLAVHAEVCDVSAPGAPWPVSSGFAVIAVSRFLDRALAPRLAEALSPGGLLFYQTFTRDRVGEGGPGNPDYLLAENELLRLFAGLTVRVYREEGRVGDLGRGLRSHACLVGQKAAP